MKIGFYAGSFDPFTIGHLEIVKKASVIFDRVIIAIGNNNSKVRKFDAVNMKNAINNVLLSNKLSNCECIIFDGLTVDCAMEYNATYLIRGLRNGVDYDYEENLALINSEISNIDTVYFRAGQFGAISSSMVNELIKYGKDCKKYLPYEILSLMQND